MLHYLWLSAIVFALDQASKFWVVRYLVRHEEVPLLPFLNLALTYNAGAAFGFLSNSSGWQNLLFIVIAIGAAIFILLWLRRLRASDRMLTVGLCLILGGAVGNMVDRFIYGYVVDFIDVVFGSWHFWTFNVADAAISVGAVILVLDAFGITFPRKT